ncbi:MAG: hypothetical protein AVDCRST_MAG75-636, partial [uncultured Propionibacteriaceae bacterium]
GRWSGVRRHGARAGRHRVGRPDRILEQGTWPGADHLRRGGRARHSRAVRGRGRPDRAWRPPRPARHHDRLSGRHCRAAAGGCGLGALGPLQVLRRRACSRRFLRAGDDVATADALVGRFL